MLTPRAQFRSRRREWHQVMQPFAWPRIVFVFHLFRISLFIFARPRSIFPRPRSSRKLVTCRLARLDPRDSGPVARVLQLPLPLLLAHRHARPTIHIPVAHFPRPPREGEVAVGTVHALGEEFGDPAVAAGVQTGDVLLVAHFGSVLGGCWKMWEVDERGRV